MTDKFKWPCPGKPEDLKGQPIGMYHCEYCGEMQLAGVPHRPPQFPEHWEEPFPKVEEPAPPPLNAQLELLADAAKADDGAEVLYWLEEILKHPAEDLYSVWEVLYLHRDDADAKLILEYLDLSMDSAGRWTAKLRED